MPVAFQGISHAIFIATLWNHPYHFLHLMAQEAEDQRDQIGSKWWRQEEKQTVCLPEFLPPTLFPLLGCSCIYASLVSSSCLFLHVVDSPAHGTLPTGLTTPLPSWSLHRASALHIPVATKAVHVIQTWAFHYRIVKLHGLVLNPPTEHPVGMGPFPLPDQDTCSSRHQPSLPVCIPHDPSTKPKQSRLLPCANMTNWGPH